MTDIGRLVWGGLWTVVGGCDRHDELLQTVFVHVVAD